MSKSFAHQAAALVLAALTTLALFSATDALAAHQYRVAVATQAAAHPAVVADQEVVVVGHRLANA